MKLYCQIHSFGHPEEHHQPPLIFLHGMTFSGNMFKNVAPALAEKTKRKAYVPDIRNHGRSPWVNEMSYDSLADDIFELMQQNNIPKAVVIGSCMGARIALTFALKYPDKVHALVVEDMTPRNLKTTGNTMIGIIFKTLLDILDTFSPDTDLYEARRTLVESISHVLVNIEKVKIVDIDDFIPVVRDNGRIRLVCNSDVIKSEMLDKNALVQNLPDLGKTFEGDALFIYGTNGMFNLDEEPTIKKLFPKAIIKRIPDASHLIHLDSPEEYTNIVSNYILHRNSPQSKY